MRLPLSPLCCWFYHYFSCLSHWLPYSQQCHNFSSAHSTTPVPASFLTLFIRSCSISAMMPFFTLRSAFVTLKGLGRGARPERSCWVIEALADMLAVTHLRTDKRQDDTVCTFQMWNLGRLPCWMHGAVLLLGEGRWSQKAEGLHSIIHLRPVTRSIFNSAT